MARPRLVLPRVVPLWPVLPRSSLGARIVGALISLGLVVSTASVFAPRARARDEAAVVEVVRALLVGVRRRDFDAARALVEPPADDATLERWRREHRLMNPELTPTGDDVLVDVDEACAHVTPGGHSIFVRLGRRETGWKIVDLGARPTGRCETTLLR